MEVRQGQSATTEESGWMGCTVLTYEWPWSCALFGTCSWCSRDDSTCGLVRDIRTYNRLRDTACRDPRRDGLHLWPRCLTSWNRPCQSSTLTMKGLLRNSPKWWRKRSQPWKTNTLNTSRSQHWLFWRITFHGWIQGLHLMRRSTSSWWRDRKKCVYAARTIQWGREWMRKRIELRADAEKSLQKKLREVRRRFVEKLPVGDSVKKTESLKDLQSNLREIENNWRMLFNEELKKLEIESRCRSRRRERLAVMKEAIGKLDDWSTDYNCLNSTRLCQIFRLCFRVRVTACRFLQTLIAQPACCVESTEQTEYFWRGHDFPIHVRRARFNFVWRPYLNVSLSLSFFSLEENGTELTKSWWRIS